MLRPGVWIVLSVAIDRSHRYLIPPPYAGKFPLKGPDRRSIAFAPYATG